MPNVKEPAGFRFTRFPVILNRHARPLSFDQFMDKPPKSGFTTILTNENIEIRVDPRARKCHQTSPNVRRIAKANDQYLDLPRGICDHLDPSSRRSAIPLAAKR